MGQIASENPASIALGRKRGRKDARAGDVSFTPEQRSEIARSAVQARWAKTKPVAPLTVAPSKTRTSVTSKKSLHLCLKRIKAANDETELRRLTEELQRILFHRQYQNAEN